MIRLIASDIDGTLLLNRAEEIPREVFEHIDRLEKKGILFCPASGRQYTSIRRLFAPIADRIPFLCENGAIVYGAGNPGPVLSKTVIDRAMAEELSRDIIALPGVEVLISGANTSYLCPKNPAVVDMIRYFVGNNTTLVPAPEDVPEDIIKVSAYCPGLLEETKEALLPRWQSRIHGAVAGEAWLDFTLADKGLGLRRLCEALGIGLDQVAAFGDNYNDLSMLEAAGRPWIMEGAAPELRARFANHCREVAEVLRTF